MQLVSAKKVESNWCSTASTAGLRRQCNQVRASPVFDAEMVDTQIERRENLLSRLSVARRLSGYEEMYNGALAQEHWLHR